jgi:protein SCO1/2
MSDRLPLLRLAIIAVAAFTAAVGTVALWPKPERPESAGGEALIGGPFALTDQAGQRRTAADFRGKHMLVFFGFTNCPDFCPTALHTISQAMEKLGAKAEGVVPVFITVDPERDTPAQLKNYAQNFDKRVVMLTGTPAEIAAVAKAWRVYYAKRPQEKAGEYTMDHSAYIYLMDPAGKFVTHFRHAVSPDDLAAALEKRL